MNKKKQSNSGGIVYSTDANFQFSSEEESVETISPQEQRLQIKLDKKHRGGKVVTLISGFVMREDELETLAKKLKNFCGTGGSAKDNEVIIQGDHRDKVLQWLIKNGYTRSKKIG